MRRKVNMAADGLPEPNSTPTAPYLRPNMLRDQAPQDPTRKMRRKWVSKSDEYVDLAMQERWQAVERAAETIDQTTRPIVDGQFSSSRYEKHDLVLCELPEDEARMLDARDAKAADDAARGVEATLRSNINDVSDQTTRGTFMYGPSAARDYESGSS